MSQKNLIYSCYLFYENKNIFLPCVLRVTFGILYISCCICYLSNDSKITTFSSKLTKKLPFHIGLMEDQSYTVDGWSKCVFSATFGLEISGSERDGMAGLRVLADSTV